MKRFNSILCVVNTGHENKHVMERAVTLAENNQASLVVIDVAERVRAGTRMRDDGHNASDLQAALVNEKEQELQALVSPYQERIKIETKVLTGTPFLEVIREVLRNGHDLVIKHPDTGDWLDRLFASGDMHLLRKCPCPVWLIKPGAQTYRRILAAVDVDDAYPAAELKLRQALNRQIVELAVSLALSDFSELHTVAAWRAIGESAMRGAFLQVPEDKIAAYLEKERRAHENNLDMLMQEIIGDMGQDALDYLKPQKHLVKGLPEREIPVMAKRIEADLVVMGTVARTGVPGFIMGNTAEAILNQLDCSVLAIKPPGFNTPITLRE